MSKDPTIYKISMIVTQETNIDNIVVNEGICYTPQKRCYYLYSLIISFFEIYI